MTQNLRSFLLFFALPAALSMGACDCADGGPPVEPPPPPTDCSTATDGTACPTGSGVCCGGACLSGDAACDPGYTCTGAPMCTSGAIACSECTELPPLTRGRMADELDSTVQADGTFVMAGYSPGDPSTTPAAKYGDLVIGTYDGAGTVDWEVVDGVPADGAIVGSVNGWRGGIKAAGDDVGRYPSIAANGDDLVVAYGDHTNGSLKVAARVGGTWTIHDVDAAAGTWVNWTSIALEASTNLPIVSYLVLTAQEAGMPKPTATLRIARPDTALPVGGAWTWSTYTLQSGEMGCHADLCTEGYFCITEGTCVAEGGTGDCAADCGSDVCFNGVCYQRKKATDYLVANGQYTDVAALPGGGFGLVYYDRTAGKLYGRTCSGACAADTDWTAATLIDGFGNGARPGAGDCGIGASLYVDPATGDWHVTYVDGTSEELRYARFGGGLGGAAVYELVDDGSAGLTGLPRPQISFVGDDSSVVGANVVGGLEIRVAYADVTLHTTVVATRAPGGGWTYQELPPSTGEASFSVTQASTGGEITYVGSEWYQMASAATNNVFLSDTDVFPNPAPPMTDGGL